MNATIAFIGGGNMARALIGGLLLQGRAPDTIAVADPKADNRDRLHADFGVVVHADNAAAAQGADLLVLAVKPKHLREALIPLRDFILARRPALLSIAAGIPIAHIQNWLGEKAAVIRAMPNTPALLGSGAAALCASPETSAAQKALAESVLGAVGLALWVPDEALMDVVTALSGSGPAYAFLLLEGLEDAAVAQGLDRPTARRLAAQTLFGAARMALEGRAGPAELRHQVTSPGGTTAAALAVFEEGLRPLCYRAIAAATRRGRELASDE